MPPPLLPGKEAKLHLKEAAENYARYQYLIQQPDYIDWALVLLFYSALHLVQAHAVQKCKVVATIMLPTDHATRASYVANHINSIFTHYRMLQTASEDARYNLIKRSAAEVQAFHNQEFMAIRKQLSSLGFIW